MSDNTPDAQLAAIGSRIRALRTERGLNLHQLARLCGISAGALSLIETGQRDLRLSSLYRIAEALRVRAGALVDGEERVSSDAQPSPAKGYDLGDYQ